MALFNSGKVWADENLFNGEYYHQLVKLDDRSVPQDYDRGSPSVSGSALDAYWDAEHGEIKYQIGEGCGIDQVLAQWHANVCGLGEIFDCRQTRKALRSVFKYNFKRSMRDERNPCRVFCLNGEAGLVICAWPADKHKPAVGVPYAEECMTGFEYAAAVQMIQAGMVEQGLEVVRAIRDRYDGEKRNPWNEFECGSNYARPMASYTLLTALSGFEFDMARNHVGFNPVLVRKGRFRCFWSLGSGWGVFGMGPRQAKIAVRRGELKLRSLRLGLPRGKRIQSVLVGGSKSAFSVEGDLIRFPRPRRLSETRDLIVRLR